MTEYGKYHSLTLINWNGFFARTFELNELVTTLSGGNGAGKSTTMAAFVTALIPDLTLLHFRNTTEAGATTGSRDKGLHGKLRPGVCYSLLEVINTRHQRILCGVRLQQIAGRDKKVDIKPFIIQGLPTHIAPTEMVTERLTERQARIRSLNELKDHIESLDGVQFKQFNSITDYHSVMFDLGVLPKRLRSSSDRSKYYRLIEASLYGGISSAITRSLRDYLLPENSGVRKAFQDMEAALRENRMTLEAIRITQSDRDLFKQLISEATNYVAADYMRHANERRIHIDNVLQLRREVFSTKQQLTNEQYHHVEMAKELQERTLTQTDLEVDYQAANDHFNLVQAALRQREKIERYQADIDELTYRLEEQNEVVAESEEYALSLQQQVDEYEQEVDNIKTQLADYQQALDIQQTRAIQYQQAVQMLENARKVCQLPELTLDNVEQQHNLLTKHEAEITQQVLQLEQRLSVADAAINQFEQAYQLVAKLAGDVTRNAAWQTAKSILNRWPLHCYQAQQADALQRQLAELEHRCYEQQQAQHNFTLFCKRIGRQINVEQLDEVKHELEMQLENVTQLTENTSEERINLRQELNQIQQTIEALTKQAPLWLKAQDRLIGFREQSGQPLASSQQVTSYMQQLLEQERILTTEKDKVSNQRQSLEQKIEQLSQPNGTDDERLSSLAEYFNGVLLSEIYDDITIDEAPYFSAVYGPARQAIVVNDLTAIREKLETLDDCPEDIYFIEGNPSSFDDGMFNCEELTNAVLVKAGDRQWRYSRFPAVPLFGRAARETQLEVLSLERDELAESYAKLSFDLQKVQRLQHNLGLFIGEYLATAFQPDPEVQIQQLNARRNDIERQLFEHQAQLQQLQQQLTSSKTQLNQLNQLTSYQHLLSDDDLAERIDELREQLQKSQDSVSYVKSNQTYIHQLEPLVAVLQSDPEQNDELHQQYQQIKLTQQQTKNKLFALSEVTSRRAHFSYADSADILNENNDLNEQLRHRLEIVETERNAVREKLRHYQTQANQNQQLLASLKSAFDTKHDVLNELKHEIRDSGINIDSVSEEHARLRRDELQQKVVTNRSQCNQLEKQLLLCEATMEQCQKTLRKVERDYQTLREQVVQAKAGWCIVLRLVKENNVERRLHRRELAYLSADELRSMSDKALGSLRLAVADNEHLRDILRLSENSKHPERKIHFYIAMYKHLRERIRQDILKTDDPIEAIEQMEIELSRLTNELTTREQKLAISSKSVANIIRKTIQREQNRIRMLNHGLQSVAFGQVNGVRLNVNIRESHATLLSILSEQQEQHQDLFTNQRITFSEALAKLYQRLNPHIDMGQRTPQTVGEALLDYRNYLELDIEVNRGADGWLRAESGALSTGEAIGTGMSILLMVIQSWEEESKRLRSKDILPCRLLFLDEAARLDSKSISTLFELCERLDMQLIIAAPENISPEKGTTYKLVRKVLNNQEHVHVVGLKGFA